MSQYSKVVENPLYHSSHKPIEECAKLGLSESDESDECLRTSEIKESEELTFQHSIPIGVCVIVYIGLVDDELIG